MNGREGEARSPLDLSKGTRSLHRQRWVTRTAEVALPSDRINRRVYAALWLPPELLPEGDLCLRPREKETI